MPLATLADRCGAISRRPRHRDLPRAALPAADQILARLSQLQPHLADLPANEPIAGEARRLIGGHLPRLVDSYLALPPNERGAASENSRRIAESLDIVADELAEICRNLDECRDDRASQTEHRFIETRYRAGGRPRPRIGAAPRRAARRPHRSSRPSWRSRARIVVSTGSSA